MQTPIVILDEPTTGQDARGVKTIERIISALGEARRTVVAISHDMRFVAESFARAMFSLKTAGRRCAPRTSSHPIPQRWAHSSAWDPRQPIAPSSTRSLQDCARRHRLRAS